MNRLDLQERLRSIHAIPITPFDENNVIDRGAVEANIEHLLAGSMDVLVACGNTGEFYALDGAERRQMVEHTSQLLAGTSVVFIVGVGHDLPTAIADARHAAEHGAHAVMVHQPPHPFVSRNGFLAYVEGVASACRVPVIPYVSRPVLTAADVPRLLETSHPVAIKYALNDPPGLAACVAADTDASSVWVAGTAEGWAPFLWPAGATGFTSGLVNISTDLSLRMLAALRVGDADEIRRLWARLHPFEILRAAESGAYNVAVVKEGMRQVGMPAGAVRPPATAVGEADRARIAEILEDWARV